MTRTSKRWGVRLAAGLAAAAALAQPAWADGWLRSRLRALCDSPALPWSRPQVEWVQPGTPIEPSRPMPSVVPPGTVAPKVETPKTDIPVPPDMGNVPPMQPTEPNFQPLISAALGEGALAVAFAPAMFGDQNELGTLSTVLTRNNPTISSLVATNAPVLVVTQTVTVPRDPAGAPLQPGTTTTTTTNSGTITTTTTTTTPNSVTVTTRRAQPIVQFPQLSYASYKIAENESPRPTDRIFATYSYFSGLPTSPSTRSFDVHRETVGFEKTFLDRRASVGIRVPFLQLSGPDDVFSAFNVRDGQFGDVSIITKYAFYDDRATGNLLSTGLMVTAPTGQDSYTVNGQRIHSTLIQPWVGTIWSLSDSIFIQGFSSIVVPTDNENVTAWFNDLGIGYWLRKGDTSRFFHGIVPTAEVHVGNPLTNRGNGDINRVHFSDYVSLLGGANFIFGRNSSLGIAAGAPVTGNKPWDFETHVTLNIRF
jgi:hypothetical protein